MIRTIRSGLAASCDGCGKVLVLPSGDPGGKEAATERMAAWLAFRGWTTDGRHCRCWQCVREAAGAANTNKETR